MSNLSIKLQSKALKEMAQQKPYRRNLAHFEYDVLPKVYKGSTDTELFCELLKVKKGDEVWDIGTGTGLIALAAKKKGAKYVLATDINPSAVKNAKQNSLRLGLKIETRIVNIFGTIKKKFDIITFNPPFTNHTSKEKHEMSFWDKDNKTVKKFFSGLKDYLKKDGQAYIAWSSFGKIQILKKIAQEYGYTLNEIGRRTGKRRFVYYIFEIKTK